MSSTQVAVNSPRRVAARPALLALAVAAALAACSGEDPQQAGAGQAPPPPKVGVVTATPQTVPLVSELPGRTEASRVAQVRARVAGILVERRFTEGSDVKAGQQLFRIDAAPYQADARQRPGARWPAPRPTSRSAQGPGRALRAAGQGQRDQPAGLRQRGGRREGRRGRRRRRPGRGAVGPHQPRLRQRHRADLRAHRPRAGDRRRAGRARREATQLAVVQQIDPIYVNFTQPVAEVMRLRTAVADGPLQARRRQARPVRLVARRRQRATRCRASCCSPT
ncbi:MAG: biotin/lipoyl-binding protein [Comamonadaceae bacterium]|nr:biotin/lipoyl-binding protein [Comamonadaceae bacterium]